MGDHHHHHDGKHAVHLALVQRLRTQAAEIDRLTTGVDEEALATRTLPDKWSMKELVCHFRRMETIFTERFSRMLTEDTTIVPYDDPDRDPDFIALTRRPAAEVLAEYLQRARDALPPARGPHARRMAPQGQASAVCALRSALRR